MKDILRYLFSPLSEWVFCIFSAIGMIMIYFHEHKEGTNENLAVLGISLGCILILVKVLDMIYRLYWFNYMRKDMGEMHKKIMESFLKDQMKNN